VGSVEKSAVEIKFGLSIIWYFVVIIKVPFRSTKTRDHYLANHPP